MRLLYVLAAALLVSCASPPKPIPSDLPQWRGRLGLTIESEPRQQNSAHFLLLGSAATGQLDLYTPLGSKAFELKWETGFATVSDGETVRRFPDLATAIEATTGANIPVSELFDWLQGKQDQALEAITGWKPDLTRLNDGRIIATRLHPLPRIELRVVVEK